MARDDTRSLMYISRSELGGDIGALERLRQQCIANNRENGLSGVLYYDNQTFLQILEGPASTIETVFRKILEDSRHRDAHVLWDLVPARQMFEEWAMKFVSGISSPELPGLFDRDALMSADPEVLRDRANRLRAA